MDEILNDFPSLTENQIRAVIAFAAVSAEEDLPMAETPKADCGIIVEPESPEMLAEKIVHLKNNSDTARKMGLNGRKYVENNLTRDIIASKYEKLFLETTGNT